MANAFGVERSTVNRISREVCRVVVQKLEQKFARFPRLHELAVHLRHFPAVTGFPQGMGALDGCHIEVYPPEDNATDYSNYKGSYSAIILAIVDHNYTFIYNVWSPERNHNAAVFHRCRLPTVLASDLFTGEKKYVKRSLCGLSCSLTKPSYYKDV